MEISWTEADPDHIFKSLQGLCVEVDGRDAVWAYATRHGVVLQDWDDDAARAVPGTDRLVEWDEIDKVCVY